MQLLFLSGALRCGQAVSAQESDNFFDLPLDQLVNVEVVSASRFKQKSSEAPSAVEVVSAEDIRSFGWRTLADALNAMRGLNVRNDRNYSYLGTRGFSRTGDYGANISTSFANPAVSEEALTVAFLYNFLKFAEWPKGTVTGELTLCVSKNATFNQELDAISGRTAQNKSIRIKRIELGESARECQLLFLPREEKPIRIREWLKNTENTPTLMVSNMAEFLDMGGMIVLINDGKRLQFEVNLKQIKRTGLKLSAQLLQIAREVRGK